MWPVAAPMSRCPECMAETTVRETRRPDRMRHAYVSRLSQDYPEIAIRRRHCPEHGTFLSVELPLYAVKDMRGDAEVYSENQTD